MGKCKFLQIFILEVQHLIELFEMTEKSFLKMMVKLKFFF